MAGPQRLNSGRQALLEALKHAGVQFVVIGGVAIASHGEEYRTQDIDLIPKRSPENLQRLADPRAAVLSKLSPWGG